MKILNALKTKLYLLLAIIFAVLMGFFYPYIQSFGDIEIWFSIITPINLVLYVMFSVLFGITVSFQIYRLREHKTCCIKSVSSGTIGSILGFLVGQCSGCVSFVSLLLPFNAVILLATYNSLFTAVSLLLLVLSLYLLRAFEKN